MKVDPPELAARHLGDALRQNPELLATLVLALVSPGDHVMLSLMAAVPFLQGLVAAGRSSRDTATLREAIEALARSADSDAGERARSLTALRDEVAALLRAVPEATRISANKLWEDPHWQRRFRAELAGIAQAVHSSPWPEAGRGYARFIAALVVEPLSAQDHLLSLKAIYESLQPRHWPLIRLLNGAAKFAAEEAARNPSQEGGYQGVQRRVAVDGHELGVGIHRGLEGSATGVVELDDLVRALGSPPRFVRLWMNELERIGVVQHMRTFDMGAIGATSWAIDPIIVDLFPYVRAAEGRGT